ncbi:MAG: hypothetical protein JO099_12720 [Acidobacteriia bacterium]|nr:hypothetical protein [Terriglobia bacterium]
MHLWRACPLALLWASLGIAQVSGDISFTLATPSGRTQFRLGEGVELEMRFSTTSPGRYAVWTTNTTRTIRQARFDRFLVDPQAGVADPLQDIFAQFDSGAAIGLPPPPLPVGAAVVVRVQLNEWVSIRQPGRYRVTAETSRVIIAGQPASTLTLRSNTVEIDVVPPEAGWAAAQFEQAVAVLERTDLRQSNEPERATRILRFLETREAAGALARFFEDGPSGAQKQLHAGLFVSPYHAEVMAAMERALNAPDRPITYITLQP